MKGVAVTRDERLASVRLKIGRAKCHIADLRLALRHFAGSQPYRVDNRPDPATGGPVYFLAGVADVPQAISVIAGDAIHNLRCALDHLAYQLVMVGAGSVPSHHVYFPVVDDPVENKHKFDKDVGGMRPAAADAIRDLEPHKGGKGHRLWVLHKLNNTDKHRLLLAAVSVYRGPNVAALMQPGLQCFAILGAIRCGSWNSGRSRKHFGN
jgi:hypothetical protein